MVFQKTRQRSSVGSPFFWFKIVLLVVFLIGVGSWIGIMISSTKNVGEGISSAAESEPQKNAEAEVQENTKPEIAPIDFQPVIDSWVSSVSGNKSVVIYDLDLDTVVGEYNSSANYFTASLYKLFVVYEGYRRIDSGEWAANDSAGSTGKTILECLDTSIRESDSICAETLRGMIGIQNLEQIVTDDFGINESSMTNLTSNANDILKIMKLFYNHPNISNESYLDRMKDSFLNQPATIYNWRQGLPSGFSDNANVYNKVGWEYDPDRKVWNVYHDAAIVEFPVQNRHFIVVVMTNYVPFQSIVKLGSEIENQFLVSTKEL